MFDSVDDGSLLNIPVVVVGNHRIEPDRNRFDDTKQPQGFGPPKIITGCVHANGRDKRGSAEFIETDRNVINGD